MTRIAITATLATGAIIPAKLDRLGFVGSDESPGLEPVPLTGAEGLLGGEPDLPDSVEEFGLEWLPPASRGLPTVTTFTVPANFGNGGKCRWC
ncbi:hypothetical protein OIU84_010302 [Salix udensis]|uniref:Uncharacterized protein n=1 Tax=Salix udensis TaxID=889485 RepID=A0AAD6JKQ1_9ROSI|nr:hypothetical protein OIU84_010302 [Salix udensis]